MSINELVCRLLQVKEEKLKINDLRNVDLDRYVREMTALQQQENKIIDMLRPLALRGNKKNIEVSIPTAENKIELFYKSQEKMMSYLNQLKINPSFKHINGLFDYLGNIHYAHTMFATYYSSLGYEISYVYIKKIYSCVRQREYFSF
jgi:hypothetical protein